MVEFICDMKRLVSMIGFELMVRIRD